MQNANAGINNIISDRIRVHGERGSLKGKRLHFPAAGDRLAPRKIMKNLIRSHCLVSPELASPLFFLPTVTSGLLFLRDLSHTFLMSVRYILDHGVGRERAKMCTRVVTVKLSS